MKKKSVLFLITLLSLFLLGACISSKDDSTNFSQNAFIFGEITTETPLGEAIPLDTIFQIHLTKSISQDELRQALKISPDKNNFSLEGNGKDWTLKFAEPLEENTVYSLGFFA